MAFDLSAVTGLLGGLASFALIIFLLIVGAGIIAIGWFSGLIRNWQHKTIIFEPRGAGDVTFTVGKGSRLPGGKYEHFYGPFDIVQCIAPKSAAIRYGGRLWGYSDNHKDIHWFEDMDSVVVNCAKIRLEPSLNPGMVQVANNQLRMNINRFKDTDKWKQYLPIISLMVAGLLLAGGFYGGVALLNEMSAKDRAQNAAQMEEALHHILDNATIVYNYASNSPAGSKNQGTGSPPPGMPPG